MEKDVIEKIAFSTNDGHEGELIFSYLKEIDNTGSEFAPPASKASMQVSSEGILWLLELRRNN
jgi:hypothetical protein